MILLMTVLFLLVLLILCWFRQGISRHLKDLGEALTERKPYLLENDQWLFRGTRLRQLVNVYNELIFQHRDGNRSNDSMQSMESILGKIRETLFIADAGNQIIYANEAARQFWGQEQALIGRRLEGLIPSTRFLDYTKTIHEAEIRRTVEFEFRRGSELFWFEANGTPLPDLSEQGAPLTLFLLHDITQRKRLETMRTEFIANVSHELRSPVTVIKGYTDTLIEDQEILSEEDRSRFLSKIQRNTVRLHHLLEDLLMLSRLESSTEQFTLVPKALNAIAAEEIENFKTRLGSNQTLRLVTGEGDAVVPVDAIRITQVLDNLLENALRHARGATELIVRVVPEENQVRCTVEDNGCGITAQDLSRIFERFYRVDKGRSRETGGTGLGLSIVKHIILQHGGQVFAESVVGQGTRIGFILPTESGRKLAATPQFATLE